MAAAIPIKIELTLGELDESLQKLESYGLYIRGYNESTGEVEDEPGEKLENVLTVGLTIGADLDPTWELVSDRATAAGQSRDLFWNDRTRIAPTRLGVFSAYHLGWNKNSILNRLTDEEADMSATFAEATRAASLDFHATGFA